MADLRKFVAIDKNGNEYEIKEFRETISAGSLSNPNATIPLELSSEYRIGLTNKLVKHISENEFEIVHSGVRVWRK